MTKDLVPSEPRTFLRDEDHHGEVVPVKGDIITSQRPSNRELGTGLNYLNREFEDHKLKTAREFRELKGDVKKVKEALAVDGGPKPSGLTSQRTSFFRTMLAVFASLSGFVIAWKMIAAAEPGFVKMFSDLNEFITRMT